MGPIALFDKSFIQALNRDEAAIFDLLFRTNITPLFFAEVLADLQGGARGGASPGEIVANIAAKAPVWGSSPNAPHTSLCLGDLAGHSVEMRRLPVLGGGRWVAIGTKTGFVFDETPEMAAFNRWQRGEYLAVEQEFARSWREMLSNMPHNVGPIIGVDGRRLKLRDLAQVKEFVEDILNDQLRAWAVLKAALTLLQVPPRGWPQIKERWVRSGRPTLRSFAPYAAHVFSVELFFQVAAATGKIAAERPSNRIDVAYLHYSPLPRFLYRVTTYMNGSLPYSWGPIKGSFDHGS